MLSWLSVPPDWSKATHESIEGRMYTQSEQILATFDALLEWAKSLSSDAGKVKSRLNLLQGKAQGSWDDNHRDWWTTLCELYLAKWLEEAGYAIKLAGAGADIELLDDSVSLGMEITTLRKGLGISELEAVLSWQDRSARGVVIRYDAEGFQLTEQELAALVSDIQAASEAMRDTGEAERVISIENHTGECEIRVSAAASSWITTTGPTKGFAIRFEHLYDSIIEKVRQKAAKGQLNLDQPSVLVLDIETWRPSAVAQFRIAGGSVMRDFTLAKLPPEAAALVVTTVSPHTGRPSQLTITRNPNSPFRDHEGLRVLFQRMTQDPASGRSGD